MTQDGINELLLKGNQTVIDASLSLIDPFNDESQAYDLDISLDITEFKIIRMGESYVKPIYTITFEIAQLDMYKVINTPNIICFLNIFSNRKMIEFQQTVSSDELDVKTDRRLILKPFNIQRQAFTETMEKSLEDMKDDENSKVKSSLTIEFFELNQFKADQLLLNMSLRNTTPINAIKTLIKESGIQLDSIAVSKTINHTIYKEIFIPPLNLFESINYIIDTYGVYKNGARLFYENNKLYIIEKNKYIKFRKQENSPPLVNIIFEKIDSENKIDFNEEDTILYFKDYVIQNDSDGLMRVAGSDLIEYFETEDEDSIIGYDSKDITKDYKTQDVRSLGSIPKQTYNANYSVNNIYKRHQLLANSISKSIKMNLQFNSSSIDFHNFSTFYNLNFFARKDQRYNGMWYCLNGTYMFKRSGNSGVSQSFNGTFCKII